MSDPFLKDPSDNLDYEFDYSAWMSAGDTIVSSVWSISPTDDTSLTGQMYSNTSFRSVCFVSGGLHGTDYELTNRITTADGRVKEKSMKIMVRNQ